MSVVAVVGDALLDRDLDGTAARLAPDAPVPVIDDPREVARAGGAGLAATMLARDGHDVTLVTALADDPAGRMLRRLLIDAGVTVVALATAGPTGEKVRVHAGGRPVARLDYGTRPGGVAPPPADLGDRLRACDALLVADYGRGVSSQPEMRRVVAAATRALPVVWDPHPRGAAPVPGVRLATPNLAEASAFAPEVRGDSGRLHGVARLGRHLLTLWAAQAVAVTLGGRGALLVTGAGTPLLAPAPAVPAHGPIDACGAGDRFSTAATAALAGGALPSEAVIAAVGSASAFVRDGGLGAYAADRRAGLGLADAASAEAVVARVRAHGGTVVATGGCFDLLHAGHVATLQAARGLGDCLVVCLNADASVRRLKGPSRPLVPEADRAAVLRGLGCVDAVEIFAEDTPEAAIQRLRPDIWAKGGDYGPDDLPEATVLASWGGQAVVLPYLAGRSTTQLLHATTKGLPDGVE